MKSQSAFLNENGVEVTRKYLRLPDGQTYKWSDLSTLRLIRFRGPIDWLLRKPAVYHLLIGTKTDPVPKIAMEINSFGPLFPSAV